MNLDAALTPRRRQVLYLRMAGNSYNQIAIKLGINVRTVRTHMQVVNRDVLMALGNCDGEQRGFLIAYTLGLLEGGMAVDDAVDCIRTLEKRALAIPPPIRKKPILVW